MSHFKVVYTGNQKQMTDDRLEFDDLPERVRALITRGTKGAFDDEHYRYTVVFEQRIVGKKSIVVPVVRRRPIQAQPDEQLTLF